LAGAKGGLPRHSRRTAKRSYGSGRLFIRSDSAGRETWYGSWPVGGRRVKRRLGVKHTNGTADRLTRTQAEAQLRHRIATETVVAGAQRHTVSEAGELYLEHLEHVMERKRTTLQDYRGYLRRHLAPFFGGRPLDKIDCARVEAYLKVKKQDGLSSKTVQNHLDFLHGIFAFSIKRMGDREPGGAGRPTEGVALREPPHPLSCNPRTSRPCSAPSLPTTSASSARCTSPPL
jgi:hypothetical protein